MPADSLAALVGGHFHRLGWTIAEARRQMVAKGHSISYIETWRICHNKVTRIEDRTVEALVGTGISKHDIILAAYGSSKPTPTESTVPADSEQQREGSTPRTPRRNGRQRKQATA